MITFHDFEKFTFDGEDFYGQYEESEIRAGRKLLKVRLRSPTEEQDNTLFMAGHDLPHQPSADFDTCSTEDDIDRLAAAAKAVMRARKK